MYEKYLDVHHRHWCQLTKFRLSCHWLPIERGRYLKPKQLRSNRVCILCKNNIGNELHAMFRCNNNKLKEYRLSYMEKIIGISSDLVNLSDAEKMLYLLSGKDDRTHCYVFDWVNACNNEYKNAYTNKVNRN